PDTLELRRRRAEILLCQTQLGMQADPFERNLARLSEVSALIDGVSADGLAETEDQRRARRMNLLYGRVHYYQGQYAQALAYYEPLVAEAEGSGDLPLLAGLSQSIGTALVLRGRAHQSLPWLARAVALEAHLDSDYDRIRANSSYAANLVIVGRYREG